MKTVSELFNELEKEPKKWHLILSEAEKVFYDKNDIILKKGKIEQNFYFLKSGIVRKYTINKEKEYNKFIFSKNHVFSSLTSLLTKKPSNFQIQAISRVVIYKINFPKVEHIIKEDLELCNLFNDLLGNFFVHQEKSEVESVTLDATQRYKLFAERNKNIMSELKLYHIASFLGITNVQLSRIRASLKPTKNFID